MQRSIIFLGWKNKTEKSPLIFAMLPDIMSILCSKEETVIGSQVLNCNRNVENTGMISIDGLDKRNPTLNLIGKILPVVEKKRCVFVRIQRIYHSNTYSKNTTKDRTLTV